MSKRQLLVASLIAGTFALTACDQVKEADVEKTGDVGYIRKVRHIVFILFQ